jgi:hypothetical protein
LTYDVGVTLTWRPPRVFGLLALILAATASLASAESLAARGELFDAEALRALAAATHDDDVRAAVATDVDDDGDIDVVARTNTGLVVWVNDGSGHFDAQAPRQGPITRGENAPSTWSDGDTRRPESIQTDGVSAPFITSEAHAVPAETSRLFDRGRASPSVGSHFGLSPSRAPPIPPR